MAKRKYSRCHKDAMMAMAALRTMSSVLVAENADAEGPNYVWFSLPENFEIARFPYLPHVIYEWQDGGMSELGSGVPSVEHFTEHVHWQPIQQWWKYSPSIVEYDLIKANELRRLPLSLVDDLDLNSSLTDGELKGCLVDFSVFENYVLTAPELRLKGLVFALTSEKLVWVEGDLLPSLPTRKFRLIENIALPLGKRWEPRVSVKVVNQLFKVTPNYRVLWTDKGYEIVHPEVILAVTRANIRASARQLQKGGIDE